MRASLLRGTVLTLASLVALGGCSPPATAPSIGRLLPGEWRLASKPHTRLTLTAETEHSGQFTMTVDALFSWTFRGHWTLKDRVFTAQIDEFPPATQLAAAMTGQTPAARFVQDVVRINETELVLRTQGQPIEERYERLR